MLTKEPTPEQNNEWKRIFETHCSQMQPNRKTGVQVDNYFRNKYPYQVYDNSEFKKIVELNIVQNAHSQSKLQIVGVFIGIDLVSGEFHIESENINKSVPIYDDLFVYRGLDKEDLKNCFLVAEYVRLTQS